MTASGAFGLPVPDQLLRRHDLGRVVEEFARRITPEQARDVMALTGHRSVTGLAAGVHLHVPGRHDETFSPPPRRAAANEARGAAPQRPAIPALTQFLRELGRVSQGAVGALLSGGDAALEALGGVEKAAQTMRSIRRFAKSCVRRDLAVAAGNRQCPYGVLALGLLRGDGSELPAEVAGALASLWGELVADMPGLPAKPLGWSEMEALVVPHGDDASHGESAQPASTAAVVHAADASDRDPGAGTRVVGRPESGDVADASATERLLGRLADLVRPAAEAAERTAAALRDARCPDPSDVALVNEAADGFRRVAESLNVSLPADEWDLAVFRTTFERFERLSSTRAELVALTGLRGPEWCEPTVAEVRRRAAELVEETTSTEQPDAADLVALTHFIRLSARADPEDQAETHRLMPLLSERLPKPWLSLLAVAALRQLELPAAQVSPPTEQGEPAPGAAGEDPAPEAVARADLTTAQGVGPGAESAGTPATAPPPAEGEPGAADGMAESGLAALDRDIAEVLLPGRTQEPAGPSAGPAAGSGEDEAAGGARAAAEPADVSDDAGEAVEQTPAPGVSGAVAARRPVDEATGDTADEPDAPEEPQAVRTATAPRAAVPLHAASPAAADPAVPEASGAVDREAAEAEAAALREGRFALAAWIRRAAGEPGMTVRVREAAALAKHLNSATGEIAHRCRRILEGLAPEEVAADRPSAVLTWAVAIRVGLIMPSAGLVTLVRELSPYAARGHQPVVDLSEALANAAQQGAFIVPEILGTVRNEAEAEEQRRTAARQADEFVRSGLQRKIRYQLATEVWLHMVGEGGVIGDLCSRVARDDLGELTEVRHQVARLRDADVVEREIDEATRHVKKRRKRIDYGARSKLRSLIGDAVSLAATWADLAGQLTMRTGYRDGNDWLLSRINDLRGSVQRLREPVGQAFSRAEHDCGDRLEAAAAFAAGTLLGDAFSLLDGQPQPRTSDDVGVVLRGELLLLADLPLTRLTLEPEAPVDAALLPRLVALAHTPPDYTAAYAARADRGDHVGTGEIVRVVRAGRPELAQELRARREHSVKEARDDLRGRLRQLSDAIDSGRRNGLLNEDGWALLRARSDDLADPDRYDFDRMPREADEVARELARLSEEARQELHERLNKATKDPRVAGVADRIARRVQADDLTTAEEFLAQAIAGKDLPPDDSEQLGIADFFPVVPAAVSRYVAKGSGPAAAITDLILQVRGALESVTSSVPPQLSEVMPVLGDRRLLGQDRLTGARKVLGQVRNLAQVARSGKQAGQTHFDNVRQVFRALGIEADGIGEIQDSDRGAGRLWMRLSGLRLQGDPVLPQFGSLVSPLGRTLRVLLVREAAVPAQLLDFARRGPVEETVIVFYLGGVLAPQQWRELALAARRRRGNVAAVLDLSVLLHLLLRPAPDVGLLTGVLAPFTVADPYTPKAAGDVPEEMFFGRDDELAKVLDPRGSCFVYGGRQLGKSALLRAAMRRVQASNPDRVVILESIYSIGKQPGSSDHLWSTLWPRLVEAGVLQGHSPGQEVGQAVHRGIRAWLDGSASRQLLILLDEADDFLRFDAEERGFANVHIIRQIMEDTGRRAKVVFAGLHSTVRFENLSNQPLAHFGQPLSVGPLKPRDAYQLLTRPLGALGYTFQDPSLPARILALANNAPALVQLFATALLERMRAEPPGPDAPPNVITRADVEAVWEDRALMSDFRERFLWTLNLDNRYRVIAYCVARTALHHGASSSATSRELMEECRSRWPAGFSECSSEEFAGLLGECVELGVLGTDGSGFRLRTPNLLRLLGTREEIEEELDQASEQLTVPRRFEGMSYRAGYCGRDTERSPLTMGQIGRLLDAHNGCFIVAGSDITHVSRVPKALEEAHDGVSGAQVQRVQSLEDLAKALLKPVGVRHRVIVLSLLDRTLAEAREAVGVACGQAGPARPFAGGGSRAVVLVTGPRQSPLWTGVGTPHLDVVSTRRFDLAGIRLWMWDSNLPFQGPRRQAEFLRRTGGWPVLAHRVAELCASPEAMGPDEALAVMESELLANPEELPARCGLRSNASLSTAWRRLVQLEVSEGEDPEVLAEMLAVPDEGEPGLAPESLRADGYGSHRDLVSVLHTLGALVEDGDGGLLCEPLLARLEAACAAASA